MPRVPGRDIHEHMPKPVECPIHGRQRYALICVHLTTSRSSRYYLIEEEPDDPAQAWCESCDRVLAEDRGWSDRASAMAGWKLFCKDCFALTLQQHQLVTLVEGGPAPD
jgi:hypothetical protein